MTPAARTVSVSFQNEDEKLVTLPSGYIAKKSYVTCAFPQGTEASAAVEGIVGTNKFTCTPDSATLNFEMNNEEPAALRALLGTHRLPATRFLPNPPAARRPMQFVNVERSAADRQEK